MPVLSKAVAEVSQGVAARQEVVEGEGGDDLDGIFSRLSLTGEFRV